MPEWKEEIRTRLAGLNLSPAREAEIVDELAQHLDDRYAEFQAAGATDDQAYVTALAELRESDQLQQELKAIERRHAYEPLLTRTGGASMLQDLLQDLRYGARMLMKKPGFTAAAIITLALGIGANTAIFGVVYTVLLRPLPFKQPERLVWLWGVEPSIEHAGVSAADFLDYQAQNTSLDEMAAYRNLSFILSGDGAVERIDGRVVCANYFSVLGVGTAIGRAFSPDDGRAGARRVAILSNDFWRERFNRDPYVTGKSLILDGESATVIGVMPPDFKETDVDLWINPSKIVPDFSTTSHDDITTQRTAFYLSVIGRLKPGVSLEQARADMDAIASRLREQYPQTNAARSVQLISLHERVVGDLRPTMLVLFGAVALVLLIACANVANLLTVRAMARAKETATRLALGAGPWRIVRQSLTESVLLGCVGGACGWMLAAWGGRFLLALSPAGVPRLTEVRLDPQVFGFNMGVSLLTGIVFGLFPALEACKTDVDRTLREHGRGQTATGRRIRVRGGLVTAQVALALVVLIGAGLLINSFARLQTVSPGFNPSNLTTMLIWLSDKKYVGDSERRSFIKELTRRLDGLPGVQSIAIANDVPIRGTDAWNFAIAEGRPAPRPSETITVGFHVVGPGYFHAMGIPVLRGRELTKSDDEQAPPVVLINETAARLLWPGEDAIGKRGQFSPGGNRWFEVVGITGEVKHDGLDDEPVPHVYGSILQFPWGGFRVGLRSRLEPANLVAAVRHEVEAIDSSEPVSHIKTMDEIMSDSVAPRRFTLILFSLFGAVALVMAGIGIYGVVAYSVAERKHEIGIRMALGASARDVLRLVIGQGMRLVVIGLAIGLGAAVALTRVMTGLLFNVSATDPVTFIIVGGLLAVVGVVACWVPAQRAKADPMESLRFE
ncbi:MAG TPA: ABC transporter permease [Blastocatellia bacterium]|nr:ABC transporter permease [Blastocatellia bacterium]